MIPMRKINLNDIDGLTVLAGRDALTSFPLSIFSETVKEFFQELSTTIMHNKEAKRYSDVVSFAFWCRKANISHIQEDHERGLVSFGKRLGRGVAFHVAPSNVPVNFAFSYSFSLLSGNTSIVRVPSERAPQIDIILTAMEECFCKYPEIADRTAFVTYPSETDASRQLSLIADVRVIWGGDKTVGTIRALPSKPRCVDVAFPDRYSIAMIDTLSVLNLEDGALEELAKNFYNDTFLMDQNACSSPQTILWLGNCTNKDSQDARKRFWRAIDGYAQAHYILQPSIVMDKYVNLCSDLARTEVALSFCGESGFVTAVELLGGEKLSTDYRGIGGYFYEKDARSLVDFADSIDERFQTITYFGLDAQDIQMQVISAGLRGIDRIVPIGQAMDIDVVWDGYDILNCLSRVVEAK